MNRIMRNIGRSLGLLWVSIFMLATYVSGALLLVCGGTYFLARSKNPEAVENYTDTAVFRQLTLDTFDTLYAAVTDGEAPESIHPRIAYFAYSLETNYLYCSDPLISDIPSFEETYGTGDPYVYYCRYTANTFRGLNASRAETETFEYTYLQAAEHLFGGEQRNYTDTAIIVAIKQPEKATLDGFGVSMLESFILRQGIGVMAMLLGIFCVSLAIVLFAVSLRRSISRYVSNAFGWLYLEIRLALVGAAVLFCIHHWSFPIDYRCWMVLSIVPWPVLYVLRCNLRHAGGGMFFKRSAILHIARFVRREIDNVFPVSSLQLSVRTQAICLVIFGLVLPFVLFFLGDLLLGTAIVRLLIPFFPLYFGILFLLFYRKYAALLNNVSNLERLSALLPQGEQLPDCVPEEGEPLYPLAKNMMDLDAAVAARAESQFKSTHKKLAQIAASADELKEQLRLLEADIRALRSDGSDPLHVHVGLKHLNELAGAIAEAAVPDRPMTVPVLRRLDLLPMLAEAEAARLPELSAAQLTVHSELPKQPVLITADPLHIRAVLDIFFANAAMYATAGSTVELQIRREENNWRFIMMNTTAETCADIDQAEGTLSSGLAQARTYLSLNGGELDYTCTNGRFGVSFVLPIAH